MRWRSDTTGQSLHLMWKCNGGLFGCLVASRGKMVCLFHGIKYGLSWLLGYRSRIFGGHSAKVLKREVWQYLFTAV